MMIQIVSKKPQVVAPKFGVPAPSDTSGMAPRHHLPTLETRLETGFAAIVKFVQWTHRKNCPFCNLSLKCFFLLMCNGFTIISSLGLQKRKVCVCVPEYLLFGMAWQKVLFTEHVILNVPPLCICNLECPPPCAHKCNSHIALGCKFSHHSREPVSTQRSLVACVSYGDSRRKLLGQRYCTERSNAKRNIGNTFWGHFT